LLFIFKNITAGLINGANILMLGLDSAGKSTLLYKLRYKDAFITMPTIGFNVDMMEARKDFTLTFWDVGGQKKMRELWSNFLEDAGGLLYVVDSSDKRRLEESRREFELLLKNESIKNVPVVVLANKQDLPGALNISPGLLGLLSATAGLGVTYRHLQTFTDLYRHLQPHFIVFCQLLPQSSPFPRLCKPPDNAL
uniref:ADP-ribosylation factor-like protein 14 n=1 Tax=Serinus canaria TaxID=9135 RepID=A0A8C9N6Q5_SERCA